MRFVLEIDCDNAAFEGDQRYCEVHRILQEIDPSEGPPTLRDINGNRVGEWHGSRTEEEISVKNYQGPFRVGTVPTFDRDTGTEGPGKPNRHNDGAMIIMGRDEYGDPAPVLNIPMRVQAKRG